MTVTLRNFYETGQQVNDEPLIVVFENFLEVAEIDALLAAARPGLNQALVSSARSGVESPGRSGSNCWIPQATNDIIGSLSLRVAEVIGMPLEFAESLQVVYYNQHEEYAPHYDAWDASTERGQRCMAIGGQRLVTCLMYLNEPEKGGGTSFPRLDMEVRARRGRMLLFHNCYPGSSIRHPDSLHGGMPVRKGEKWACNFWFREKPYQKPGTIPAQRKDKNDKQDEQVPKFSRII